MQYIQHRIKFLYFNALGPHKVFKKLKLFFFLNKVMYFYILIQRTRTKFGTSQIYIKCEADFIKTKFLPNSLQSLMNDYSQ